MTLGHASILLSVVLVAVPFAATLGTGQPAHLFWLLLAPLPSSLVYSVFATYSDWTLGHFRDHLRGEDPVEAALDDVLRPPIPTPGALDDDGSFFVPDCPALAPRSR